jgi:putative membrane protein
MATTAQDKHQDSTVLLLIKGLLIGVANIIPGVSGGTFALILGIYDRLITALQAIGMETVRTTLRLVISPHRAASRQAFWLELQRVDFWFLTRLAVGALVAILACSFIIDWLLVNQPGLTLAFFLGLIVPSIAVPWRMMPHRKLSALVWLLPGVMVTLGLSLAFSSHAEGSTNPLAVLAAGAAAISAMILPGISGSFLMLVIGQYRNVLQAIQGLQVGLARGEIPVEAVTYVALFALGCGLGLLAFARLLGWVLARYRAATLAFLIGLVLGSFYVLWPFKDFESGADVIGRDGETKTEIRIATAPNQLPQSPGQAGANGLVFLVGLGAALGVERVGGRRQKGGSADQS